MVIFFDKKTAQKGEPKEEAIKCGDAKGVSMCVNDAIKGVCLRLKVSNV